MGLEPMTSTTPAQCSTPKNCELPINYTKTRWKVNTFENNLVQLKITYLSELNIKKQTNFTTSFAFSESVYILPDFDSPPTS